MVNPRIPSIVAFFVFSACLTSGQVDMGDPVLWFHPNQELSVRDLPVLTASDSSTVLATALETALHDKAVCCGKNSALEDDIASDPQSLKDVGTKLQGRHVLDDGHYVLVNAEYVTQSSINSGLIISNLLDQHALLIQWKSHLYVLYGAVFNDTRYYSGRRQYAILKLLLLDPRYSDQRRETVFNRETDDLETVQGLLTLSVTRQ